MTRTRTALPLLALLLASACGGEPDRPWVEGCWHGFFLGRPVVMQLAQPHSTAEADAMGTIRLAVSDEETLLGTVAAFGVEPNSAALRIEFEGFFPFLAWVTPIGASKMTGAATGAGLEAEAFTWLRLPRCSP